ncbi:DUF3631 domain-containing protein [Actinoallomurus purpureus]|uniref:DUF3631 domain-containing protein n=1 Tax=Actinoallomurus purpureus TaxID=478114 RepID=UPI002093C916|nr:DUF3631 domain-containing protein [Actinoallomurus purpureus]MCO6011474.1 DUF3631 domain-containing protein [Actinoallomurus purpureus]
MGTTTQPRKADLSLNPRGTVSATAEAAIGLAGIAALGSDIAHISPVWGAIGAVGGALGHLVVARHHALTPGAVVYRLGCWAGAGGWLTWALATHEWWKPNGLAALAVGAAGAGLSAPLAGRTRDNAQPGRALVLRSAARTGQEWESRFRRVCKVSVEVTAIKQWPTGAGFDVHGKLPPGGATVKNLQGFADALATDADLPDGCGIEFERGQTRATFVAHVSTVNRLTETIDYPEDYSPRSIYDPIDLGEHRNSSLATVELREDSAVVVGQKRSGKSNTLDILTAGVGRCRDALVCHLDMNGGGISQVWLHPWLEGVTDRPAILWSAATAEEALYMTTVLLAIAKHRKSAYRKFKVTSDSKLLQLSEDLPEIVIVVDEGAEVLGSGANADPILRQVRSNIEETQRIGGNEGVNVVPSGLRATQDVIAPAVVKQSRVRIGMLVQDQEELAYLFGWQHRSAIDPADLSGKGSGFIATGAVTPKPFKAYYMKPSQITRAAVAIARQRPELDASSAAVADGEFELDMGGRNPVRVSGLYSGRLDRMRRTFGELAEGEGVDEAPTTMEVAIPEPAEVVPVADRPALWLVGGNAADWPSVTDLRAQTEPVDVSDAAAWPPIGTRAANATETAPAGVLTQAQPIPEILTRALAAFDEADITKMHSETLAAELDMTSTTELSRLLVQLDVRALPEAFYVAGKRARGYARDDLETAAARVARGEQEVPDEVAEWPAA